ncbi:MarR family EPS-associated transcriptional regulator [Sphingorhabdus profundilacus]|uniref:MarR family EPS-associated transcriptional regulator n=1 Tax=Sphingorhabdus profundilacus TaxID=2509718 RepID=UPI001FE777F4|nr:MarR family EPS-associated transcriptional regulator [Sphingorhabdus profundilacus]
MADINAEDSLTKSEEVHFRVMRIVEESPSITQREISAKLGISLGRVNYCINALAEKGLVKIENFKTSETKWRYVYVLTPSGIAEKAALTGRFLARKVREYEALSAEIEALRLTSKSDGSPPEAY